MYQVPQRKYAYNELAPFVSAKITVSVDNELILGQLSFLKRCDTHGPLCAMWTQCLTQLQSVYSYMVHCFHQLHRSVIV